MSQLCEHPDDSVVVTNRTGTKDYQYGTKAQLFVYWCPTHQSFGSFSIKEKIPVTVSLEGVTS